MGRSGREGAGGSATLRAVLDRLRELFPLALAVALPLVGAVFALLRFSDGHRDEALRIGAATLLGLALYALLLL